MAGRWYYGSVEWVWPDEQLRINLPGQAESFHQGDYQEVVETLSRLGMQGWEVVTCVSGSDWIYWTLRHEGLS